jgi:type II secretory pathway component PulF
MTASEKQLRQARFWRRLLRLTRGRVPVLRALEVIIEEETHAELEAVIRALLDAMEQGATFREAVEKHPAVFSPSVRELVATAERSGAWDDILLEIADGLEEGTFD